MQDLVKYKEQIKTLVNKADPWHLIEMGAPEDEYNSQIDKLISFAVNDKPGQKELESELYTIFKTNEHELEKDVIEELAKNIVQLD